MLQWTVQGALVVVNKPAGVATHRADGRHPDVVTLLRAAAPELGLVAPAHRIDLETSGVLLLSADPAERAALGRMFTEGAVHKRYLALVHGAMNRKGIVRRPLDDGRRGRPLEAVTRYRALERLGGFTLVAVRPEHGRKHQIRRHLQMIGNPIVGDARYGPRRFVPVPAFPNRLWLHAESLELPDGRRFEVPLAPELQAHLEVLRAGSTPPADA